MDEKNINRWQEAITPHSKAPQPWTLGSGGSWDMLEVQPIPDEMLAELMQRYYYAGTPWNCRSLPLSPNDREYMYLLYCSMQGLVARMRMAEKRAAELEDRAALTAAPAVDAKQTQSTAQSITPALMPERVVDTLIPKGLTWNNETTFALLHEFAVNVQNEFAARYPSTAQPDSERDALILLRELVELRDQKAEYDAKPHMHHVYWWHAKLTDYNTRWPSAWKRAATLTDATASTASSEATAPQDAQSLKGWKEAAIAWEVCASIHREYAKKKDALFTTRQADFVRHAEKARAALTTAQPAEKPEGVE